MRRISAWPDSDPFNPDDLPPCAHALLRLPGPARFALVAAILAPHFAAAQTFSYDAAGRLVRSVWPDGRGVAYTYDTAGNITNVQPLAVPVAPGAVEATATNPTSIKVSWHDNGASETGYSVQRRTADGDTWATIADVSGDTMEFLDENLTTGTEYPLSRVRHRRHWQLGLFVVGERHPAESHRCFVPREHVDSRPGRHRRRHPDPGFLDRRRRTEDRAASRRRADDWR